MEATQTEKNPDSPSSLPAFHKLHDASAHPPVGWAALFVKIHERARTLIGKLQGRKGPGSYRDGRKAQRKSGRRKGVLVDKKAA